MKRSKLNTLRNASLIAVGLVLARGAQATTLIGSTDLTFDNLPLPNNTQIPVSFGSAASPSNPQTGVTTTTGGTPDVSVDFVSTSNGHTPVQFEYFEGGSWNAAELFNSSPGNPAESILFSAPAKDSITLNSFNFQPYNTDSLSYSYTVTVFDITTSKTLVNLTSVTVPDNSAKQLVTLNAAGGLGDTLELTLSANVATTAPVDFLAIDDLGFSELVPEPGTTALLGMGLGTLALAVKRRKTA
jgi:hypothetical protein